jgi:arsenite methyltransferase
MTSPQELKSQISQIYAQQLRDKDGCCEGAGCCEGSGSEGIYPVELLERMPEGTVTFGCGNPVALASLRLGERVLDLGSGAGLDCLFAAQQVGSNGFVIGVDFTQDMIDRATQNAAKLGLANVSFRLGDIESLPLPDASVDAVISNCVVNLAPDKPAVFRETFRVLSPGGRLMVSDIVLTRPATDEEMADLALLAGCISGSLPAEEYLDQVREAGFENARLEVEHEAEGEQFWFSAAISAVKPL